MSNNIKRLKKSIKCILIMLIAWWTYNHTAVTLNNTDSVILTEMAKVSFVATITYIAICTLTPVGRLLFKFIDKMMEFKSQLNKGRTKHNDKNNM